MRKQNRVLTTAVLVIFVLCHILPLHNAISKCVPPEDDTVSKLKSLVQIRRDAVISAEQTLQRAEDKELIDSIAIHSYIQAGLGAAGGSLGGPTGAIFAGTVGGVSGAITGTIVYYRAINNAKAALEAAKTRHTHAQTALELAMQAQADAAIQPRETHISIFYTPTHTIDISTNDPIKEVDVYFVPTDWESGNSSFGKAETFDTFTYSTSMSHTFSEYDKGNYSVTVTVYIVGQDSISKTYEISVDQ